MECKRWPSNDVLMVVTSSGGTLYQRLTFPDSTIKNGVVSFGNVCEEGDDLYCDLAHRENPVFSGTQRGWQTFVNSLLASRGQRINFR